MNNDFLTPYSDEVCVEPVSKKQILVGETASLQTYGKVLAKGTDCKYTEVGDYVAFEIWDNRPVPINEKNYHFISESKLICKIPTSWISD